MSQNLSEQVEKELEELRDDIKYFFQKLNKTESEADEIRYRFSVRKFYEVMLNAGREEYKQEYENAKEKYEALFPIKEVFSVNRKG